jgi:hypothetical protein
MSVEFEWNNVMFRATLEIDGNPEVDGNFYINDLFVVDGKTEIKVNNLLQDLHLCDKLNDAAFDAYKGESKFERSFP